MKHKRNAHRMCASGDKSIVSPLLQFKRQRVLAAALAAGVGLLGSRVQAASDTWVGNDGATNNWSDGLDWLANSAPAASDLLNFGVAGSSGTTLNDDLGAGFSIGSISFLNGASAFTFGTNNASSINLGTGGIASITNNSASLETISNINLALNGTLVANTAFGNETINSVISGTYGLLKIGAGTLSLTGANTYSGATSIGDVSVGAGATATTNYGGGTLDLNFAAAGAPTTNILYNGGTAKQFNFGGGTLEIDGKAGTANSQSTGVLNLSAGFSTIDLNPGAGGTVTLNTGNWTAPAASISNNNALAGQMNFIIPTGATLLTTQGNASSSSTAVSGILSFGGVLANATVNGSSWAVRSGGQVVGLPTTSYFASTTGSVGTGAQATDVVTNVTLFLQAGNANSLRFNTAANETLTISLIANMTVDSGGILMTPNVGAHTEIITNGFLGGGMRGAANAGLSVFQYDTQGTLEFDTPITNNGNNNNFTMGGGGTVAMTATAVNTYTGSTNIDGGTLIAVQNSNFGAAISGTSYAAININGGTLEANATFALDATATTGFRNIGIGSMGATLDVAGSFVLTVPGTISSQNIAGAGNLNKTDTGILNLSGTNTYAGNTTATGGILELSSAGALPGGVGATGGTSALVINGGIVGLTTTVPTFSRGAGLGSNQVQWTGSGGFAAINANATVNLGGAASTVKWNSGGFVPSGSSLVLGATAATKTVTFANPIDFNGALQTIQVVHGTGSVSMDGVLSGALSDSTNTIGGFNKTGNGILGLTGTSTYTGLTNINTGTLLLASGGSLGNTTVNINSAAILTASGATSHIGGTVDVNSGGALDLRNGAATDLLTLGTLSLAGGGSLGFDLGASTLHNDSLAISNFSNAGITTLNFASVGTLTAGSYVLINGGSGISTSDFVFNPNQFSGFSLNVTATGGNNLTLNVVAPPPPPPFAYWKGTVDSVWSDASGNSTNWVDANGVGVAVPGAASQVIFSAATPANQTLTTLGTITAVDSVTFTDPTSLTIGGTGTLTLGSASTSNGFVVTSTAGTDVIGLTGVVLGKPQTWSNASSNPFTVSSVISGTSTNTLSINSSGSGVIRLTGTNTYAGGTIISNGTLQIGNTAALGTGSTTINGGALDLDGLNLTLHGIAGSGGSITDSAVTASALTDSLASTSTVTYAGSITNGAGTVSLSVTGSGLQILTGASNTYSGGTTVSGTLQIGDGVSNIGSLPGNVVDNKTLIFKTPAASTFTYAGNISGTGSLTQSGGGVALLTGNNTMSGGANVTLGTIRLGLTTGLNKVPVALSANTVLDLNSYNPTITSLTSSTTATSAMVLNSFASSLSTLTVTATGTYNGKIIDGTGQTGLALTGGTFTLQNAGNTYTGPTTITGGVLSLKAGGSLGNTAVALTGGSLAASGATSQIGGIVTVNSGGAIDLRNGAVGDVLTMNGLSLAGGGALDFDLGATSGTNDSLLVSNFTDIGTTALNFANVGTLAVGSSYTLISGAVGITASDFTYNPNQFAGLNLSVTTSGNNLVVSVLGPPPPPPFAYWNGTIDTVWSDSTGGTTNWVDANGVGVALPTSATQIIFSASGATKQASTSVGAISSVDSITVNDPTNLTITGTNTLTLAGTATGNGIVINSTAGTDLITEKGIALGSAQTWQNNSSNLLTISSVISGVAANTLTINSSGTGDILLAGADTYAGGTIIANGTLQVGNATALGTGSVTVNGGALDLNGRAITVKGVLGSGGIITDSIATAATLTDSLATGTSSTYAGSIGNGAGTVALSLTGSGTQVLSGSANTYSGGTTIGTSATLIIGDGTTNAGSLAGNVADGKTFEFNTPASATVTYAGNVSGSGSLIAFGPGAIILSGDNKMVGGVTVTAGTVQMGSSTGIDKVPLTVGANGTFDLNSQSVTVSTLTTATTALTAIVTNNNSAALSTLSVAAGGNYYGKITDGAGQTGLTLTGGTLSLFNSANSYTGATTINGGVFLLKGGGSLGNTPVAINNNGILTTTGTTSTIGGNVTVNTGGALDLRNGAATDVLTMGGLSLSGGGSLGFDLGATTGVNDALHITNFSNIGTTALNFTELGTLTSGTYTYTLINGGTGIDPNDFSFNSGAFSNSTFNFIASLSAPGGTSLVLTVATAPPPPPFAYWNGNLDSTWSTIANDGITTNWVDANGVGVGNPGGTTQVIFSSAAPSNEALTTLGSIKSFDSLTLNTATNLTITGANTITLNAATTGNGIVVGQTAGTDTISVTGISLGAAQTWSNNSNNLLTVSSIINGGAANTLTINNSGTGDILLSGANTYTGGTVIANGTLQIGSSTALGSGTLAVNGGTLDLNGQAIGLNGILGSGGLITDSTNTFASITDTVVAPPTSTATVTNTLSYAGSITDGAGQVTLTVTGGGTQILLGTGNNFTGGTTLGLLTTLQIGDGLTSAGSFSGNLSANGTLAFDTPASSTVTYSGNVSGFIGVISQIGSGTVILGGDNTQGLGLVISAGTVQMGSTKGIDAVPVTMAENTTLDLHSFSVTASSLNPPNTTPATLGTTAVITNNVANTTATLTITGGGTYNGEINNGATTGGVVALANPSGTLILTNLSSNYTGGTTITGGTVDAGNGTTPSGFAPFVDNILGTGAVTVTNGTLQLNSQATASAAIGLQFNFSNSISLNGSANLLSVSGINYLAGPLAINGTGNTIRVSLAQQPLEIGGNLSGTGSVTISGAANTNPPKNVQFYGDGTAFTGNIILNASAAQIFIGNNNALNNANITLNGNYTATNDTADIYYPNNVGSSLVFSPTGGANAPVIGSISSSHAGDGKIILATSDGQAPVALSIGNNNGNSNLSGVISDISTAVGAVTLGSSITKIGTGSLTLSAANTFSGGVTIKNGTFIAGDTVLSATASSTGTGNVNLVGGVLASSVGVQSYVLGSVLGGNTGSHTIAPGGIGTIGSLNIGGLTTAANFTTLNFDLGSGSGVVTNGDLLTIGAGTINVASGTLLSFGGTPVNGNDYRLIGAPITGGLVGGITDNNFVLPTAPAGFTYALSNNAVDPGFIDLIVGSTGPANLVWSDGTANHLWDTGSSNWISTPTYSDGSTVTFDDTAGAGHYAVTLNTLVKPGSMIVNNSGGDYTIAGTGSIGGTGSLTKSGSSVLTLATANIYSGGTTVTGGILRIAQTSSTTSALPVGTVTLSSTGILQLATNATLGSQSSPTPASNIEITGLSISGSAQLDINNNHIIIEYTPGNDPIASIAAWIASGFNGGTWTGAGIMSTTAQSNSGSYGIGYADAADPGNPAGLASGQIEITYTLLGDANLDGAVNGSDFAILATNFNKAVSGWDAGDFNYDGAANGADFALLASNFNKGASQAAIGSTGSASLDSVSSASLDSVGSASGMLANVPEPASTSLLTISAISVLARRRRKVSRA